MQLPPKTLQPKTLAAILVQTHAAIGLCRRDPSTETLKIFGDGKLFMAMMKSHNTEELLKS
jgi:hypothetical protein